MSVRRLSAMITSLENNTSIQADDIAKLREAAGPKVSSSELSLMDSFVNDLGDLFSSDAAEALEVEFGLTAFSGPTPSEFEHLATHKLKVPEASGLVSLSEGRFLVVDDQRGVLTRYPGGSVEVALSSKDHKNLKELEGLCLSSDGTQAYAISERTRKIVAMTITDDQGSISLEPPEVLGKLPKLGQSANKGWEGIDILPAAFSPIGEDCLVAVHEGEPRRIGIFSLPDLEEVDILSPPASALKHLSDISDIAIHPTNGHLFLLSDESRSIVEVSLESSLSAGPGALLESTQLQTLGHYKLPIEKSLKPEGLSFSDEATLWVACDGNKDLLEIKVS